MILRIDIEHHMKNYEFKSCLRCTFFEMMNNDPFDQMLTQ
jgi:hypothetical protein